MVDAQQWISVPHLEQYEVGRLARLEVLSDGSVVEDDGVVMLRHQL